MNLGNNPQWLPSTLRLWIKVNKITREIFWPKKWNLNLIKPFKSLGLWVIQGREDEVRRCYRTVETTVGQITGVLQQINCKRETKRWGTGTQTIRDLSTNCNVQTLLDPDLKKQIGI